MPSTSWEEPPKDRVEDQDGEQDTPVDHGGKEDDGEEDVCNHAFTPCLQMAPEVAEDAEDHDHGGHQTDD